jgi:hypothetical protein
MSWSLWTSRTSDPSSKPATEKCEVFGRSRNCGLLLPVCYQEQKQYRGHHCNHNEEKSNLPSGDIEIHVFLTDKRQGLIVGIVWHKDHAD